MKHWIVVLVFLSSCSSYTYHHPAKTEADFKKDHRICDQLAEEKLTNCYENRHCFKYSKVAYYKECMKDQFGWERRKVEKFGTH